MKAKQFLFNGFLFLIAFFGIYILLFYLQLGSPVEAEWWVSNTYTYKDARAKKITSRKIIIIGGSNALFGVNSQLIDEKTGIPVLNLATHGGLDIDFFYYKIKQQMKDEDIVVLPLEFEYYTRTGEVSEWFSHNMQAWGEDYLKQLSPIDLVKFIISAEPVRIVYGIEEQIVTRAVNTKRVTEKEVIQKLNALWEKESPKWRGYSYESLNKHGDINVEKTERYTKEYHYVDNSIEVAPHFIDIYRKIEQLVKQNHGLLYITYPVTMKNKGFDLSNKDSMERIANLENKLKQHEITLQCNPALFNLNRAFFFDSHYHPDKCGALISSYNLSDCLNRLTAESYSKLSYSEALNQTDLLEKEILQEKRIRKNGSIQN